MLLEHFTPDVQLVSTADYTPGLADEYGAVVLIGNDAESPMPTPVLADLRNSQNPVLWMGYGFSALGTLEGQRVMFEPGFWTDQHLPSGIAYGNTIYPARVADYSQVSAKPPSAPIALSSETGSVGWNSRLTAWLNDADGYYHLVPRAKGRFVALSLPLSAESIPADVTVSATVRKVGGPAGGGAGIILRQQDPEPLDGQDQGGRYYVLEVGDQGEVGIWRRERDKWVDIVPWTLSSAVVTGISDNEITASAIGDRLSLRVNGVEVAAATDRVLTRGSIGVFAGGDDNDVEVKRISVNPVVAKPSSERIVAEYTSSGPSGMAVPALVQSGNLWYANLLPSFESASSPGAVPTLILADALHDFVGDPGDTYRRESLVRLSGLTLSTDPQRLDAMSKELQRHHMPFIIGIRPGVALALASRPGLVEAVRRAQLRGGLTAEELDDESQVQAAYDALTVLGITPQLSIGTPSMFSHVITDRGLPYPVKDNEHVYISSDLGSSNTTTQLAAATNLLTVRDAWAVAVQDVNGTDESLAHLLDGLFQLGYTPADFASEPFAIRAKARPSVTDRLSEWAGVEWPILGIRIDRLLSLAIPYWPALRDSPWETILEALFILGFLIRLREQWRPASEAESQSQTEAAEPVAGNG